MGLFSRKKWDGTIQSPVEGTTYALSKVKDPVFSKKMMGDGVVIKPESSKIYSPIAGTLTTVFPTSHAYGITNKEGLSLLIHIGLDTVNLGGKGFTAHVSQGAKVKKGALLAEIDIPFIKKNAPSVDVIMVITPESKLKVDQITTGKKVTTSDTIITTK